LRNNNYKYIFVFYSDVAVWAYAYGLFQGESRKLESILDSTSNVDEFSLGYSFGYSKAILHASVTAAAITFIAASLYFCGRLPTPK